MARKEWLQEGAPKARFRKAFGDLVPRVLPMRVDSANKGDSQGLHGQTRMPPAFFEHFSPAPAPLTHAGTRDGAATTPHSLHSPEGRGGSHPASPTCGASAGPLLQASITRGRPRVCPISQPLAYACRGRRQPPTLHPQVSHSAAGLPSASDLGANSTCLRGGLILLALSIPSGPLHSLPP